MMSRLKIWERSIGAKIFSIAAAIVAMMLGVSVINARYAGEIARDLDTVANGYIVAYGALARAHVRSLEASLNARRMFIDKIALESPEAYRAAERKVVVANKEFRDELDLADSILRTEQESPRPFIGREAVGRVRDMIVVLRGEQARFEEFFARDRARVRSGDLVGLIRSMAELDRFRDAYNATMENARRSMLEAARGASAKAGRRQKRMIGLSFALVLLTSLLALGLAAMITRSMVRPVVRLVAGTKSVVEGRLDLDLPVTSRDEIGLLTGSFNLMTRELGKGKRARDMFGRYVDPRIVKDLIERPELVASAGERRVMTVMFCDIAGFTTMSERMAPAELLVLLNRYFSLMSQAVGDNGGVIDKYIGDAVMAFWGAPFCDASEQGLLAARAALAGAAAVASLRADAPGANVRFGVATGEVVVGNIGSETTRSYTVIGDAVNLASRLEGANKAYGSGNLISKPTADMIAGAMELREIDTIVVPGKSQAKRVYEILGARGAVAPRRLELRDAYAAGLEAYRREAWAEARKAFEGGLTLDPGDGPAKVMAARAAAFQDAPPARPWDGTWVVTQK